MPEGHDDRRGGKKLKSPNATAVWREHLLNERATFVPQTRLGISPRPCTYSAASIEWGNVGAEIVIVSAVRVRRYGNTRHVYSARSLSALNGSSQYPGKGLSFVAIRHEVTRKCHQRIRPARMPPLQCKCRDIASTSSRKPSSR